MIFENCIFYGRKDFNHGAARVLSKSSCQMIRKCSNYSKPPPLPSKSKENVIPAPKLPTFLNKSPPPSPERRRLNALQKGQVIILIFGASLGAAYMYDLKIEEQQGETERIYLAKKKAKEEFEKNAELEKEEMRRIDEDYKRKGRAEIVRLTSAADWGSVRAEVVRILEHEQDGEDSIGPLLVRLAWHSAGTYDKLKNTGGTEGAAMRWDPERSWGANAGLEKARKLLAPIKRKFPDITFSDLWSFAGTVAIEHMGGPALPLWRPGRCDVLTGENALVDGLLPDANGREHFSDPAKHIRFIFNRMGFEDREIVALLGAHALGRCHKGNSGYEGAWTRSPTTFSNSFFKVLRDEKWVKRKWDGPMQYENEPERDLMMLPTDLALIQDENFKKYVDVYANDEALFFRDFSKAWLKLQENGVRKFNGRRKYLFFGPRQ